LEFKPFKIGKYLLLEKIASGGMAEVYRAKASGAGGFEKQLAIKRILPNYSSNDEFRRMFEYEARLSSQLTHANIVQIYDFVKSQDTYLLAMEYVDGKNLRQFLNKAKKAGVQIPIEFGIYIINEVCKGLDYAHKKKDDLTGKTLNIIHRDMSPQNIMVAYEGGVKIVDFGIAKAKDRVDETRSGVIKGKFGYMSPEQANGESIDRRSDIFSTGIILYEMLVGKRLFVSENDLATLRMIQECAIQPPSKLNSRITPELEKIVLKSLTKDLSLRYQHASDFGHKLLEYLNKNYPSYSQRNISELIQKVFANEIQEEKRRFEQILKQSVPFSQSVRVEDESVAGIQGSIDGSMTGSEVSSNTLVTDENELEKSLGQEPPAAPEVSLSFSKEEPVKEEEGPEQTQPSVSLTSGLRPPKDEDPPTQSNFSKSKSIRSDLHAINLSNPTDKKGSSTEPKSFEPHLNQGEKSDPNILKNRDFFSNNVSISRDRKREEPQFLENKEWPEPETNKRLLSTKSIVFISVGLISVMLWELFTPSKEIKTVVENLELRNLTNEKIHNKVKDILLPKTQTPEAKKEDDLLDIDANPKGDCVFKVVTDPAGVEVFADKKKVGVTPTTLSWVCDATLDLALKKEGYETITKNYLISPKVKSVYESLRRVQMGTLRLTVDQNAELYIDGKLEGKVESNKKFEKLLRSGKVYLIQLSNNIFDTQKTAQVTIESNQITTINIKMEDTNPHRSLSNKNKKFKKR